MALPSTGALHRKQEGQGHTALKSVPLPIRVEAQPTHPFAVLRAGNTPTAAGKTRIRILLLLPAVRLPQTF